MSCLAWRDYRSTLGKMVIDLDRNRSLLYETESRCSPDVIYKLKVAVATFTTI